MAFGLEDYRLVFVGPARGKTAVGDYAENFINAVGALVGDVAQYRTGGPGEDTVSDVLRGRRAVRDLVALSPRGRVLVHAEIAAGLMTPFWSIAGLRGVPVTATIHDPPQGIWWPARTRFMARHRLINHGFHYPLRPVSTWVEGLVNGRRTLFALTETGRRSIEQRYPGTHAIHVPHLVCDRPAIRPAEQRPKAVGFFGHVYRGKGFEQIARIRQLLSDDILIRVAGRGTESLPRADGIDVLGGVDGPDEDAFFESVRAVVVPYGKRHFYDETYPASGVVAHATAYCTPIVCTGYGSLAELGAEQGAVTVRAAGTETDDMATALATAIASLVNDPVRLTTLGQNSDRTRQAQSAPRTAEAFVAAWSDMLTRMPEGV
jgi:polysaccharide biosynthesis protein PslF